MEPGTDNRVYVGGSLVNNHSHGDPLHPADWDAALYRSTLTAVGVNFSFGFRGRRSRP